MSDLEYPWLKSIIDKVLEEERIMITKIAGEDVEIVTEVRVISRKPTEKLDVMPRAAMRAIERMLEEKAEYFVKEAVNNLMSCGEE